MPRRLTPLLWALWAAYMAAGFALLALAADLPRGGAGRPAAVLLAAAALAWGAWDSPLRPRR